MNSQEVTAARDSGEALEICFICDNGYVMPTSVAITSLLASRDASTRCRIYIVADELSAENEAVFMRLARADAEIRVIRRSAADLRGLHVAAAGSMCVATPAALLKFFLGECLPHLDRVLYADGDVIFRQDMTELYRTDLGDNLVAAVPDTGIMYSSRPILRQVRTYFNSGIMLLNLKKMREEGCSEKLVEAKRKSTDASLMDQNIFNLVFDGRVLPLPVRFNCLFVNLVRAYGAGKFRFADLNAISATSYRGFDDLLADAAVIHYSSKDKPWKVSGTPLCGIWENAYAESPFGGAALERTAPSGAGEFDFAGMAGRERPIIVSLTSFPGRIDKVHVALESILAQTRRPDRIILWLAREEFPGGEESLPDSLKALLSRGVEIGWADRNLRAHKKYLYTLRDNPDAIVMTVDDDLVSPKDLVETLYRSCLRFPKCISALRTHLMSFSEDGALLPYRRWPMTCMDYINRPNTALFATTGAGVVYPPGTVPRAALDPDAIEKTCLFADDVWMKLLTAAAGVPVVNPSSRRCELKVVDGTQEEALWESNVLVGGNDRQIESVARFCAESVPGGEDVLGRIRRESAAAEISEADLPPDVPVRAEGVPAVSVVVAFRNCAPYLEKCLSSLGAQTMKDFEVLCIDDGSTDDPAPVLAKYAARDPRFGVFRRVRRGISAARGEGLSLARGRYVVFVDAAGFCARDFLSALHSCAEGGNCDVAVCGYMVYGADSGKPELQHGVPRRVVDRGQGFAPDDAGGTFFSDAGTVLGTRLVRRAFLESAGIGFPLVEDDDGLFMAVAAVAAAGRVGAVARVLYNRAAVRQRDFLARADGHPGAIVDTLAALHGLMDRLGVSERFRSGFRRLVISACSERLVSFTRPEAFRALHGILREGGFERMGAAHTTSEDVGWPMFRLFDALASNEDGLPFLQEYLLQSRALIAARGVQFQDLHRRYNALYADVRRFKPLVPTVAERKAMRVGMLVTWPLRKFRGGVKCLRENGVRYTVKHAAGKVLRRLRSRG